MKLINQPLCADHGGKKKKKKRTSGASSTPALVLKELLYVFMYYGKNVEYSNSFINCLPLIDEHRCVELVCHAAGFLAHIISEFKKKKNKHHRPKMLSITLSYCVTTISVSMCDADLSVSYPHTLPTTDRAADKNEIMHK